MDETDLDADSSKPVPTQQYLVASTRLAEDSARAARMRLQTAWATQRDEALDDVRKARDALNMVEAGLLKAGAVARHFEGLLSSADALKGKL